MSRRNGTVRIRRTPGEPGDLLGAKEAAALLGVERTRISRWVRQGKMPEPVSTQAATDLWLRADIERFKAEREAAEAEREAERQARTPAAA